MTNTNEAQLSEPGSPARVSRSEAELLTLTRALMAPGPRYLPALRHRPRRTPRLEKIGPTAMGLLQQTLARGVAFELLRRGGWQTRRTLVNGHAKRGTVWQRHRELPPLTFGPASFELLSWLRAEDVSSPKRELPQAARTTLADELLYYLAAEQIVRAGGVLRQPAFLRSPLCQLGYADALAGDEPLPKLDLRELARGEGAIVLEALQPDLCRRWVAMERAKGERAELSVMTQIGQAQDQVLASLFSALDLVDPRRRELASFLAEAARELLARGPERRCPDHRWWIGGLDLRAPLSARQSAFAASAAFLRGVAQLGRWLDEAGVVAHFDEDYEAAQLLLSSWQYLRSAPEPTEEAQIPATILDRAIRLANQLESLHSLGQPSELP
ncbi:hypothetical protein ENSA5_62480 [Enhygromyxa salina]|uniref:FtsH ternary system domain-containing protein n=1 Tax=Enhygromyxa salina TaxID=215803 RepID=A0A2S9XCW0_9BACT|nr:hypothetical protein [Enhygromyxa salina]PRP90702.1 hypothetical protein ENSA5_62480 [Enhygromyxa salina]